MARTGLKIVMASFISVTLSQFALASVKIKKDPPQKTSLSTQQMAQDELNASLSQVPKSSPSEVQVDGMIRMQSDEISKAARDFKYQFSMNTSEISFLNSSQAGSTQIIIPANAPTKTQSFQVALGSVSQLTLGSTELEQSLGVSAQFAQRQFAVRFLSGNDGADLRQSYTQFLLSMGLSQKIWHLSHGVEFGAGVALTNISSVNSLIAQFESPALLQLRYQLNLPLGQMWQLHAFIQQQNLVSPSAWIAQEQTNLGAGASILW